MAKARLYSLVPGAAPKTPLKGQSAVVFDVLSEQTEPMLASDLTEKVLETGRLKTRQDALRVVLYYLIVFKGRGLVAASEQPVPMEVPEDAGGDVDGTLDEAERRVTHPEEYVTE
jgi:hypothetical protein